MDGQVLLGLAVVGGAVGAPLAAAVTSIWPSGATRWAARACLVMVVVAVALLGLLWWETTTVELDDHGEGGDDSGVYLAVGAIIVVAGLVNLGGFALANARARRR